VPPFSAIGVPIFDDVPASAVRPPAATVTDDPTVASIAAGWYADPMGGPLSRWWDGSAWTGRLAEEAPGDPGAAASIAATTVEDAPVETAPVESHVPATDLLEPAPVEPVIEPVASVAAAPMSRRQLRELVGPLTTTPVAADESHEAEESERADASRADRIDPAQPSATKTPSPFDALLLPVDAVLPVGSLPEAPAAVPARADSSATASLPPAVDSTIARPWIGAAAPLVPAASVPVGFEVVSAPTSGPVAVEAPAAAAQATSEQATTVSVQPAPSIGSLGFSLPPDPFATPDAALKATPPPYVPPTAPVPTPHTALAVTAPSTTWAIWLLALLPVVHAALIWVLLDLLQLGGGLVLRYVVLFAPVVIYLALARADHQMLRRRGFVKVAPTALALVPVLYLLIRAIRVGASGVVPLLAWLLLQTGAYAFLLLQLPAVFALVPLSEPTSAAPVVAVSGPISAVQRAAELTPSGMAAALTTQTLAKNLHFESIVCPAIPVTVDGTAVSCVGTLASVKMNLNVVVDSSLTDSAFALVGESPAT
jgi:hypothetical protein